jgi:xylulokinase
VADLLMGIDMGTSGTKGVLADPDGEIVAQLARRHRMSLPRPGWAEMDAERDWWGDLVAVLRELVARAGRSRIAGVTVSGLGPCLLMCDENVQPLRPAILYGIDMRAREEIAELTERYGEDVLLERCGKLLSSQAVGPKLLWVRRREPEVYDRARRWYSSHSFAVARLTGEYVLDRVTASQCDPLYDLESNRWNEGFAREIAPGLELPRLAWSGEVVGTVTAQAAEQTGLAAGTPVCAGTVDAWSEALSVGVRRPGDLMLMYGSTVFLVQVLEARSAHRGLWTTAGIEDGPYTLAAGMATSGSLTDWVQDLTGGEPFARLVEEAAGTPAGADGLVVLPHFAGERSPVFAPRARGVVAGLTLRHRRGHLFRAVYEGIGFGIRQILHAMAESAGAPSRIVAVGGGTQGGLWTQIVSDITNRAQVVPRQTIGASYGGALLAGIGTGLLAPDADWSEVDFEVKPEKRHTALYDELYETYAELYPATRAQVHRLAAVQENGAGVAVPGATS